MNIFLRFLKKMVKRLSLSESRIREMKFSLYLLRTTPLSMLGLILISIVVIIAVFAAYIAPYPSDQTFVGPKLSPPSLIHLLGTDDLGRDLCSRVLYGSRVSLLAGLIVLVISMSIGTPLGLVSGFYGSWMDELIMRVTDIFLSIPSLVLAVMFVVILGPRFENAIIAVALTLWPRYARLIRGQTLSIKEASFIEAAISYSASSKRIIFRHILPNTLSPLIVQASFDMGTGILFTAALSFLGIGAQPPTPEWGLMVSAGRAYLPRVWWYSTLPGIAIFLTVLGFNLLGDGLRDILDPKLRQQKEV